MFEFFLCLICNFFFFFFQRKSRAKRKRTLYLKKVFNMTLPKTLSFCHLGLLYTEDLLSLSDLIRLLFLLYSDYLISAVLYLLCLLFLYFIFFHFRFAYEGKVPYVNIIDKLPPSFVLQKGDTLMFLSVCIVLYILLFLK